MAENENRQRALEDAEKLKRATVKAKMKLEKK